MPFVPSADTASLEAVWQCAGQLMENTFHYKFDHAPVAGDLQGIADTYISWASAHTTMFSAGSSLEKLEARDLTSEFGPRLTVIPSPAVVGTASGLALPNNVTLSVKRQTGLAGRKMRGRVFLCAMPAAWLDGSEQSVTAAVAAAVSVAYDALLTAQAADNTATEVILHRSDGTTTPVVSYTCADRFVDSQRRRLPGHNRHR